MDSKAYEDVVISMYALEAYNAQHPMQECIVCGKAQLHYGMCWVMPPSGNMRGPFCSKECKDKHTP